MILLVIITRDELISYRKSIISCLNKNSNNSSFTNLIVLTNEIDSSFLNLNSKISVIYKKNITQEDVKNEFMRFKNINKLIKSDPFVVFGTDLYKITQEDVDRNTLVGNGFKAFSMKSIEWGIENPEIKCKIETKRIQNLEKESIKEVTIQSQIIRKPATLKTKIEISERDKKLDVIIVSVNYNDYLVVSLSHNVNIFNNITVVTSTDDIMCQKICEKFKVNCVVTDVMYENGSKFNKGKAINKGIDSINKPDFILILDADIIVKNEIDLNKLSDSVLYTSDRWIFEEYKSYLNYLDSMDLESNATFENNKGLGFFQLFNVNNKILDKSVIYPETFDDASWSDLIFRDKFTIRQNIDIPVFHLGPAYQNWKGRVTSRFLTDSEIWETMNRFKEKITILYPPTINWDLLFQRPQQLMKGFSKQEKVTSIFWNPRNENKPENEINKIEENLYLVDQFLKIDNFKHLFNGKKILWFSHPSHHYLSDYTNWDLIIFDAIDNPVDEFAEWSNELNEAVRKSDIIFASAKIMYDEHKKSNKPVYMLPNGSDFNLFFKAAEKLEKPKDFPNINGPVVGYYGAMATWLDWEIVKKIADKYNVVMIGGNKYYNERINHPNIHYLDHKKIEELPNYLSHIDVPIIPFKLTEMIKGCDPIKFYEYIASGKPAVVTEMLELKRFEDICYFMNIDNCLDVIKIALSEDNEILKNKRIQVAKQNSWDIRAEFAIEKIRDNI